MPNRILDAPGRNFRSTFRAYPERYLPNYQPGPDSSNQAEECRIIFELTGLNLCDEDGNIPRAKVLQIVDIEQNVAENTKAHHCYEYEITSPVDDYGRRKTQMLVIRRGQPFDITFQFNRPYNKDTDKVSLQFSLGEMPQIPMGTLVRLPIPTRGDDKDWTASHKETIGNELTVTITPPSNCYIGIWRMMGIVTDSDNQSRLSKPKDVYILFNPFSKDDDVFMNSSKERDEYVMNQNGLVYQGTLGALNGKGWNFAQFQGNILDCVMYLLEKSELPYTDRGKPVLVSRRLSAMVNANDEDGGVVEGNWDPPYVGGTDPQKWQGSETILEEYWSTKQRVKYGQCWVFSGVLTTVYRALGIPCRSVTNVSSGRDNNGDGIVIAHYDEKGILRNGSEMVWNYHLWNEVYMARPDLRGRDYGGWQAIDSTPQEMSGGVMCCGPAPVRAVKNADTSVNYDTEFVIAEVNGFYIEKTKLEDGRIVERESNNKIGKYICTKAVLQPERIDITNEYKFAEGTAAERAAVMRAVRSGTRGENFSVGEEDVKFEVMVGPYIKLGSNFHAKVKLENTSNETRKIKGNITVSSFFYTGVLAHQIVKKPVKIEIPAGSTEILEITVTYKEYAPKLVDQCHMNVNAMMLVDRTDQLVFFNESYELGKPELLIKAPVKGKVEVPLDVEVSFRNPLNITLTGCELRVEGPGITKELVIKQRNVIPGETFAYSMRLAPRSKGNRAIYMNFSCEQIVGIHGTHLIEIA